MEKNFKKLAEELTEFLDVQTGHHMEILPCKRHVIVDGKLTESDDYDGIDVFPANDLGTIYRLDRIADFVRYHNLSHIASTEEMWNETENRYVTRVYIHIF